MAYYLRKITDIATGGSASALAHIVALNDDVIGSDGSQYVQEYAYSNYALSYLVENSGGDSNPRTTGITAGYAYAMVKGAGSGSFLETIEAWTYGGGALTLDDDGALPSDYSAVPSRQMMTADSNDYVYVATTTSSGETGDFAALVACENTGSAPNYFDNFDQYDYATDGNRGTLVIESGGYIFMVFNAITGTKSGGIGAFTYDGSTITHVDTDTWATDRLARGIAVNGNQIGIVCYDATTPSCVIRWYTHSSGTLTYDSETTLASADYDPSGGMVFHKGCWLVAVPDTTTADNHMYVVSGFGGTAAIEQDTSDYITYSMYSDGNEVYTTFSNESSPADGIRVFDITNRDVIDQPDDLAVFVPGTGSTGVFSAGVTGQSPWQQWWKIDAETGVTGLAGETGLSYTTLPITGTDDNDGYTLQVFDAGETGPGAFSDIAHLVVYDTAGLTGPIDQYYTTGNTVTFDVYPVSGAGFTYAWEENT